MRRNRPNPRPLPATPPDNRALFDSADDDAGYYGNELDTPELFGGSTDEATVERVTHGLVAADWRRA
jgi:hypothetical protein